MGSDTKATQKLSLAPAFQTSLRALDQVRGSVLTQHLRDPLPFLALGQNPVADRSTIIILPKFWHSAYCLLLPPSQAAPKTTALGSLLRLLPQRHPFPSPPLFCAAFLFDLCPPSCACILFHSFLPNIAFTAYCSIRRSVHSNTSQCYSQRSST